MARINAHFTESQRRRLAVEILSETPPSAAFLAALQQLDEVGAASEYNVWHTGSFHQVKSDIIGQCVSRGVLAQRFNINHIINTICMLTEGQGSLVLAVSRNDDITALYIIPHHEADHRAYWRSTDGSTLEHVLNSAPKFIPA